MARSPSWPRRRNLRATRFWNWSSARIALVDGPHAADADEAGEGVGADAGADGGGGGIAGGEGIGEDGAGGALPGGAPAVEGGEQAFDFGAQRGVGPAGPVQVVPALGHRALQRCVKQLPNPRQPLGGHPRTHNRRVPGPAHVPSISRCRKARAKVQSRFTVAGEMPIDSAVCSMSSPPKKRSSTTRA